MRYFIFSGPVENWEATLNHPDKPWGTRGTKSGNIQFNRVSKGDLVAFYATKKRDFPGGIIGFGIVKDKKINEELIWPDELRERKSIYPNKIYLEILHVIKDLANCISLWPDILQSRPGIGVQASVNPINEKIFAKIINAAINKWPTFKEKALENASITKLIEKMPKKIETFPEEDFLDKCWEIWAADVIAFGEGKSIIEITTYELPSKVLLVPKISKVHYKREEYKEEYQELYDRGFSLVNGNEKRIEYYAEAEKIAEIRPFEKEDIELIEKLSPFYIWTVEHVKGYFKQQGKDLAYILALKTYKLPKPFKIKRETTQTSRFTLDQKVSISGSIPVLPDDEYLNRLQQVRNVIKGKITLNLSTLPKDTFLPVEFFEKICKILEERKQIIFYGPLGTGKTFVAKKFAKAFAGEEGKVEFVQFHPSYGYEDFVEGIKPELKDGQINYKTVDGIFKKLCDEAAKNPNKRFVLIIDEINRGNIPRIFGELIYCLEYRGKENEVKLPSGRILHVPENLYIIATMNSSDRSIALVDFALRRRFVFFNFMPSKEVLDKWFDVNQPAINKEKILELFREINKLITADEKHGKYYQIGHSYFMHRNLDEKKLQEIWEHNLLPLLEEYYFEESEKVREFEKIFNRIIQEI